MAVIKYHCKLCPESTYLKEAMTLHMMTKHLNLEIKDAENQDPPRASVQEEEEKEKDHDVEDDNEGRLVIDEKGLVVRKRNSKCLRGGKGLRAGDYLDTVPTGTAIKKKRKRGPSGAAVKKTRSLAPPPPLTPTKLVPTSVPPGIFSPNRIAFDPLPVIAQLKEPLEEYNHNKNTPDIDGNNNDNNNHGQPREPAKPSCGKCGQTFSDMNKATQDHVRNCFASALGSESTAGPNVADNNSNNAAASAVDSSVNPKAAKDEKKVSCPECNLRFKSKTGMFLHVDSVHRGIR